MKQMQLPESMMVTINYEDKNLPANVPEFKPAVHLDGDNYIETRQAALVSSNLEKAIDKGIQIAAKLSTAWAFSDFTAKQKLQYLIFPEGILYDKKNNTFRTTRVHSLFAAIPLLADILDKNKTGNHQNDYLLSSSVGTTRFELATPSTPC